MNKIPTSPKSWFYFGLSSSLKTGEKKLFKIADIDILVYRSSEGVFATNRFCPHMNADLLNSDIIADSLRCSLHYWSFDNKGECKNIPHCKKENFPAHAKLQTYAVKELFGHIFIFNASIPSFDLPFFHNEDINQFTASRSFTIFTNNEWYVGPANAFDLSHFITVHKRKLLNTPIVSNPDQNSYRIDLSYEILGNTISDRLLVCLYGKTGGLDFSVIAGNFILAVTRVKNFKNYMMIISKPLENGKSEASLIIFSKKSLNPMNNLKRFLQGYFSQRFFQEEANSFYGIKLIKEKMIETDQAMIDYLNWLENYFKTN